MRVHTTIEEIHDFCPEDDAMSGWVEETSVYVSVAAVDDGDVDEPPSEM